MAVGWICFSLDTPHHWYFWMTLLHIFGLRFSQIFLKCCWKVFDLPPNSGTNPLLITIQYSWWTSYKKGVLSRNTKNIKTDFPLPFHLLHSDQQIYPTKVKPHQKSHFQPLHNRFWRSVNLIVKCELQESRCWNARTPQPPPWVNPSGGPMAMATILNEGSSYLFFPKR